MGENKKEQKFEQVKNVQPQIYGSDPEVSNNNEEGGSSESEMANKIYVKDVSDASKIKQPIRGNPENQDIKNDDKRSSESHNEDDYEESMGMYTSRSQLNEMEDGNMMSRVEGDDEDILDETENSRRNQQRMRESGSDKDRSQDR
ncbi:MAG: hypothetical protein H7X84_05910 [Verrucomicrobia bacterium]|nr:hypothetical protein [Prolixibacteraceae bacterium]